MMEANNSEHKCPKCRQGMEPVMWHGRRWRCTNPKCSVSFDPPPDIKIVKGKPELIK
jgi:ssDNA-binding Zn-finger/Zn-ribbon topoisomerase 1